MDNNLSELKDIVKEIRFDLKATKRDLSEVKTTCDILNRKLFIGNGEPSFKSKIEALELRTKGHSQIFSWLAGIGTAVVIAAALVHFGLR
jgi:hypothetical protein